MLCDRSNNVCEGNYYISVLKRVVKKSILPMHLPFILTRLRHHDARWAISDKPYIPRAAF